MSCSLNDRRLCGPDVLSEVGAAGPQHAGDLDPPDLDRVAADHELERLVDERQPGMSLRCDDKVHAAFTKTRGGDGDAGREAFRGR